MASKSAILAVRIIGDAKSATDAINATDGAASKLAGFGKMAAAGIAVATGAAVAFGGAAVDAAGDLEQSIGAIDTVFKGSADQMHAWADTAAMDVGLTKNEFNELGTLIGTQLKNGGTAMDELAPKTNNLIGVGADLASMFGGTTADAVGALSSALKGERDPIERYGVSLNQAAVDAKAAELGFEKVGGSLSAEANQAATLAIIMDQTADAHGNFAKESDTLQGKQQRFTAALENTKAAIGTALLPVVTRFLGVISDNLLPMLEKGAAWFGRFMDSLDAGPIRDLGSYFQGLSGTARGALDAIMPSIQAVGTWITTQLVPAVQGLAQQFIRHWTSIAGAVGTAVEQIWVWLEPMIPTIQGIFTTIGEIIVGAVEIITEIVGQVSEFVLSAWEIIGPPIITAVTTTWEAIIGVVGPAIDTVKAVIDTVMSALRGDWSGVWDGIKGIVDGVWRTIKGIVSGAIDVVRSTISGTLDTIRGVWDRGWSTVQTFFSNTWTNIKTAASNGVDALVGWFRDLPDRIMNAISGVTTRAKNMGKDIIRGMLDGVKSMGTRLINSVKGVIDDALGAAKRLLGIASPSKVFRQLGQWTGIGLADGITGTTRIVSRAGRDLAAAAIPERLPSPQLASPAGRSLRAGSAPTIQINIDGALDPRAVARQIRDLLTTDARLRGVVSHSSAVLP